jgi:hypothetical protein
MTEERARYYAKAFAHSMGVTFYAVRSRAGRFLAIQVPSDDCKVLATFTPPRGRNKGPELRRQQVKMAA